MSERARARIAYDGKNSEWAKGEYRRLMTLWMEALMDANRDDEDFYENLRRIDAYFSQAQDLADQYKFHHGENIEGFEENTLELKPPRNWDLFSDSEEIADRLYAELLKRYLWLEPREPGNRLRP